MAIIYVNSGAGGAANGTSWTDAYLTITAALAKPPSAGDTIYVHKTHSVTAGVAIPWTPIAGDLAIICVDKDASDAWSTGAIETVGAASAAFTVTAVDTSALFIHGITLGGGSNNNAACDISLVSGNVAAACVLEMSSCTLQLNSIATTTQIILGSTAGGSSRSNQIKLRNSTISVTASRAGTVVLLGEAEIEIVNPTFTAGGATKPAVLFAANAVTERGSLIVRDGDLSGHAASGGAYFDVSSMAQIKVLMKNLKISGTPSLTTGTWPFGLGEITLRNVDSGDTINTFEYRNRLGTLAEDTATYAASGASFNSTSISWQVVTTSACDEYNPFVLPALSIWNTSTSAQTATVEILRDSATDLTDREVWLELSYPASASFPNYTAATDRNANPFTGTPVDQPNSAVTWTEALTNDNEQYISVAFTAAEVGMLEARVYVAKASTTLYIDPLLRLA